MSGWRELYLGVIGGYDVIRGTLNNEYFTTRYGEQHLEEVYRPRRLLSGRETGYEVIHTYSRGVIIDRRKVKIQK